MNNKVKRILQNVAFAFSAQGASLILSIVMSLIVPKILGVEQYSYWQLFIFYAGYVNLFHFGINDGVYLKLGGEDYRNIDHKMIGGEVKVTMVLQLLLAVTFIVILQFSPFSYERNFVMICVAIYMVIFNTQCFIGYIFQAVNLIKYYSKGIMIDKLCYIFFLSVAILMKVQDFKIYIIFYIVTCFISLLYLIYQGREMLCSRLPLLEKIWKDIIVDAKVGINLTLASIASSLVIGISRMIVDYRWGITFFGKLSFALSLTNFLLLFIRQIGLVLYPILRKENDNVRAKLYIILKDVLLLLIPIMYLVYIPIKSLLEVWLPEYKESLLYLSFLLPLCAFDGEMQIVGTTYLKVLRKENILFKINTLIVAINAVCTAFTVYLFDNIYAVIIEMVIVIVARSIFSDFFVQKFMKLKISMHPVKVCFVSVLYVSILYYFSPFEAFWIFGGMYILILVVERRKIVYLISCVKDMVR